MLNALETYNFSNAVYMNIKAKYYIYIYPYIYIYIYMCVVHLLQKVLLPQNCES